ncbi:MAG: malate synthase A [Bacteroidota bacterium]
MESIFITTPSLDQVRYQELPKLDVQQILTPEAVRFLLDLHERFNGQRLSLLAARQVLQQRIDAGWLPDFLPSTAAIREADWQVAPVPADLQQRTVEITGPVDRKMIINALNSDANVFMADFEDASSPTWENMIAGQINLKDANAGTIDYFHPKKEKWYRLNEFPATLMVRPRGWHLEEQHFLIEGKAISASLFDLGLYCFHNLMPRLAQGKGTYFYLPKLENHQEARLWNDIFVFIQDHLNAPKGVIKATVLIETILAAYEMDEILYELKDHSAGLNCGRWDYIFSVIKKFRNRPEFILPDRAQVTMAVPFMRNYSKLLIQTCHRRGAHAMGGMAAQIPVNNDPKANENAFQKVRADKVREANDGHDGTWVAHPGLVKVALEAFQQANSQGMAAEQTFYTAADLVDLPEGTITERGVRENINVAILYIESWLRGVGAAALYHKMEDAATAEISRAQLWQWIRHACTTEEGTPITYKRILELIPEELNNIKAYIGEEAYAAGKFDTATQLLLQLIQPDQFHDFLTTLAYEHIL